MSNMYIESRISNFINRKLATFDGEQKRTVRATNGTSGIYYEPTLRKSPQTRRSR